MLIRDAAIDDAFVQRGGMSACDNNEGCQQEKSQHKNRSMAMRILRSKLLDIEREKQETAEREARRAQVKTGDRSEKIRTYNFPQDRLTDHRIGLTKHNLPKLLDGDIQEIIDALRAYYQAEALKGSQS